MKWTKADRKRAERMGFDLDEVGCRIRPLGERFTNNRKAVAFVVRATSYPSGVLGPLENLRPLYLYEQTCRKAVTLCCQGRLK